MMSTVAKLWTEPRCPSTDEWIKTMWSPYTTEYCSAVRKDECLPLYIDMGATGGIMLSEISQLEKDNYHTASLICGI